MINFKLSDFAGKIPQSAWMRKKHFTYLSDKYERKMIETKNFKEFHYWIESGESFILLGRSKIPLFEIGEPFDSRNFINNLIKHEQKKDRWVEN